jgi:hypothetical protein
MPLIAVFVQHNIKAFPRSFTHAIVERWLMNSVNTLGY